MLLASLIATFGWTLLVPYLWRWLGKSGGRVAAILPALLFCLFAWQLSKGAVFEERYAWAPSLGVELCLRFDGLTGTYLLLITGIGALIVLFAAPYEIQARQVAGFDSLLFLFMGAMQGLVLADDIITLFVFWELTSVTSYLLIGFESNKPNACSAARQALLITSSAGMAMLLGLLLLSAEAGTRRISELHEYSAQIAASPSYEPILLLIALGAFAKSAIVPFHFWLPNAMAAPTPVSAYLHSATMVKAGIYLLARLRPTLGSTDLWFWLLAIGGSLTLIVGAFRVVNEFNLKRILAETTLIGLGALLLMLGMREPFAVKAFAIFLVVHALYKASLFMIAGAVDHATHTKDLRDLGGLWRRMRKTSIAAVLAGVAMLGMPPMLGFVGKELIYEATLHAEDFAPLWTSVVVLGNAAMVTGALLVVHQVFFGKRTAAAEHASDPPFGMLIGPFALGLSSLLFGIFHIWADSLIAVPSVIAVTGREEEAPEAQLLSGGLAPLGLSVVTVALGVLGYRFRNHLMRVSDRLPKALKPRLERGYEWALQSLTQTAELQTRVLQNGRLPVYGSVLLAAAAAALSVALGGELRLIWPPVEVADLFSSAAILFGVLLAVFGRTRIAAALGVALAGYGAGLLFALFGATDVALAQFAAESLLLLALVFITRRLSSAGIPRAGRVARVGRALLALSLGAVSSYALLRATSVPFAPKLSNYFEARAVPDAHGHNVVNTILVDFRAMDTLGEILVLAIAALSLWPLSRGWGTDPEANEEVMGSLMLRVLGRVLLPLFVVISGWLLLRGHDQPGGGFTAGLVLSGGLMLYALGNGPHALRARLRVQPETIMAAGLIVSLLSGVVAFIVGAPFLTGIWPTADFGTPLLFDAGVYLVVVGGSLTALTSLWKERGSCKS